MIVGSIKEDINSEKRVSITPETAKNIMALGLSINLEKDYAIHLGIEDKQYEKNGVKFYSNSKEVINNSKLILKVNCPTDEETKDLKEKTISCKNVTFKIFGLSLATINTIISLILSIIITNIFYNYEKNK